MSKTCCACGGSGEHHRIIKDKDGKEQDVFVECSICGGYGKVP